MTARTDIDRFAAEIAARYTPEKIILFGSYARNEAGVDSDVDMLVILDHESKNVEKAVEMRNLFHPRFPLDLLVRKPGEVRHRIELNDCFLNELFKTGIVLFEASHLTSDFSFVTAESPR